MSESRPDFIVVEGPIGVGKTSLARRLARSFGSELLLEGADENPFLERFYKKPREAALPTQLFFLFQRARQMQELRQADMFRPVRVSDFLIEKDRLFAELTLEDDEFDLYEQVYENMTMDAPQPDLVIYLQAPVEVLLNRIGKRGHDYERNISAAYLQRLNDSYTRFFHQYCAAPLLIVNAAELDFVNNTQDYETLLERVKTVRSGRHFFNPQPFSL
ncbi:MAG: deoxynucleoside kinase [Gammaproteobacteria bacterium]|nr:deoxynucleoside kinase [Gammaproteobacteria bacterium]